MSDVKLLDATGWKAIPVILAVLAFGGYRMYLVHSPLDSGAAPVIEQWLMSDYARQGLKILDQIEAENIAEGQARQLGTELSKLDKIQIKSMSGRGSGDNIVVRAEISVDGKTPPDGESVRYFRMRHSMIAGWRVKWDTSAFSYYMKLW